MLRGERDQNGSTTTIVLRRQIPECSGGSEIKTHRRCYVGCAVDTRMLRGERDQYALTEVGGNLAVSPRPGMGPRIETITNGKSPSGLAGRRRIPAYSSLIQMLRKRTGLLWSRSEEHTSELQSLR